MKIMTSCAENHDVLSVYRASTVMKSMTSLFYHTYPTLGGEHVAC